jgi:protein-L-isoaspartate(D-aspartate) O-methyltransferase
MDSGAARMVREQLRPQGIVDERVLAAMTEVPREEFVPPRWRGLAYEDRALAIGMGQTISQPLVVAAMTQALRLQPEDDALEVGTGSGYQAAVLSRLCRHVVSVEREPALAERAAATLRRLGFENVEVALGDGSLGWRAGSPYRGILVACAAPEVPPALLDQLDEGGRLVMPIGSVEGHQELTLLRRTGEGFATAALFPVRFVPMLSGSG